MEYYMRMIYVNPAVEVVIQSFMDPYYITCYGYGYLGI